MRRTFHSQDDENDSQPRIDEDLESPSSEEENDKDIDEDEYESDEDEAETEYDDSDEGRPQVKVFIMRYSRIYNKHTDSNFVTFCAMNLS